MDRGRAKGSAGRKSPPAKTVSSRGARPLIGRGGVSTDDLMRMALEIAGLSYMPEDSAVHVPGKGIKRILFALDVNVGLLLFATQRGYDCVLAHHPCGTLLDQGEVYRRHIALAIQHGISPEAAQAEI